MATLNRLVALVVAVVLAATAATRGDKTDPMIAEEFETARGLPVEQSDLTAPGVGVEVDLEYARAGETPLLLDLYTPKEVSAPLPVVVWIHGGGWRSGSKSSRPPAWLARHGFAVAAIDYRYSDVAVFPAQIHDCKAAIRWIRANADRFQLDGARIAVWGASSGGHLASLLGTSGERPELEGTIGVTGYSSRVQAVCSFASPIDFLQMDAQRLSGSSVVHNSPDSPESLLLGGPITQRTDLAAAANPTNYIVAGELPPFLILHGTEDLVVPPQQSVQFQQALKQAGGKALLRMIPKSGHGFGARDDIDEIVRRFFERNL